MPASELDQRRAAYASGVRAERAVALMLQRLGWDILAERWRCKAGEIDLIAQRDARLRFVEVKLRQPGDPVGLECVTPRQVQRVRAAAEAFLSAHEGEVQEACLLVALAEPDGQGTLDVQLFDDPD